MSSRHLCRSCHAPVEWALTLHAHQWIPLDLGAVADGNLAVVGGQKGTPLVRLVPLAERSGLELRRTHFASCPYADQHRRSR